MTRPIRLLLHGDVDLDVLDGSAVSLTSLAETLTRHPRVELTVLLAAPDQQDVLASGLRALPRTDVVRPPGAGRMRPSAAVDRIEELDRDRRFAAIVLRGLVVSLTAAERPSLTGRLWPYLVDVPERCEDVTAQTRAQLATIAAASELLLCRTPELRDHLESVVPATERRTALLPPTGPGPSPQPPGTRTVEPAVAQLTSHLDRLVPQRPTRRAVGRPHRLLVASHELKFLRAYLPWFERVGVEVRTDPWGNPDLHDEASSRDALAWADAILAEWCLGNATWYAEHRRSGQRLTARLHRVELTTPYPARLAELGADALVTVSDHVAAELTAEHGWDPEHVVVLPNAVDTVRLDRDKLPSASTTLGLIGFLPRLKRLDRALDLLVSLRRRDPRWQLRVAGSLPFDSPWVWARVDERAYFQTQLERVRRSPGLRRAVAFDASVVDVPTWLRRVGTILSPSEVESFHLAVAEGMASGARPVVWDRTGAADLFPPAAVVRRTGDAVELLRDGDAGAGAQAARFVRERYAIDDVAPRLVEVVLG